MIGLRPEGVCTAESWLLRVTSQLSRTSAWRATADPPKVWMIKPNFKPLSCIERTLPVSRASCLALGETESNLRRHTHLYELTIHHSCSPHAYSSDCLSHFVDRRVI